MPSPFESVEVVPYQVWVHQPTGRQASLTGAAPWTTEAEKAEWEKEGRGYTWKCTDHRGAVTFGACRQPVATKEEAEEVAERLRGNK